MPGPDALERHAREWLFDCQVRQLSPHTIDQYRRVTARLVAFLRENDLPESDRDALRQFLATLKNGHTGGAVGPRTVEMHYVALKAFFGYLVAEEAVDENPLARIPKPVVRQDQIQPFSVQQVQALLAAARRSDYPARDEALLLFLLDTGCRRAEVCSLRTREVDLSGRFCTVTGKGNKERRVYFSAATQRALWRYLKHTPRDPEEPLFLGERGRDSGAGLQPSGVYQVLRRLGKAAGLTGVRCSPHTLRHTFGTTFAAQGGNSFSLMSFLGHTTMHTTNRYVTLAQADLENQHRANSPVEALLGKKNGRRP